MWIGLFLQVLDELQRDPWPVPGDQREARCTSTALSIAASLLGACVPGSAARIMAFIGGPATEGPAPVIVFFLLTEGHCNWFHSALDMTVCLANRSKE